MAINHTSILMHTAVIAACDRDHIKEVDDVTRVGTEWSIDSVLNWWGWETSPAEIWGHAFDKRSVLKKEGTVRWRLLDSDDEVYYGGWLVNDSWCITQQAILQWGMRDAGAVTIQIKVNGEWVTEIG